MIWLLDTNIISELTKPQPDLNCLAWLHARKGGCYVSVISLAELRYGVERLPEGKRKSELDGHFQFLIEDYRDRIIDFDGAAATEWGRYATELEAAYGADWWKTFDFRDTQICATAREYGLEVATRNERHFPFVKTVNPFAA